MSRAAAVALVFLSLLLTPAQRDLFVGDETKYGAVVREMRSTGAFFLPTLNGTPFTHKPPLHFWLIDLLTFPLGVYSTWAFVLPSIAALALLLWLMWRMGGPLAAFVCATSLMVWGSAQTARMDVAFTAFIALGAWQMNVWLRPRSGVPPDADALRARGPARPHLWCGAALGVATLIKGPMAIVIGVILFILSRFGGDASAPPRDGRGAARAVKALLIAIAIPLLWFIPAVLLGGRDYARDVVVKQTVGRAISSWVHQAPPWFYVERLPLTLFPWFFLALASTIALWRTHRFLVNWILAVLVLYSLLSSKLDVYMMALIPPVALLIADGVRAGVRWARAANLVTIALLFAGAVVGGAKMPREFTSVPGVNGLIAFALIVTVIAFIIAARGSLVTSTLMAGAAPIAILLFVVMNLMPFINGFGSTQTLISVLQKQRVPAEGIALYSSPYLWARNMPREYERVRYVDQGELARTAPVLVVTSRAHANEIAGALQSYHKVDEVRLIGKWFDVYRR